VVQLPASFLLRRSGEISGPHPRGLLRRHRALGRIGPTDEVSIDGVEWIMVEACIDLTEGEVATSQATSPAGDPAWVEERRQARLRWLDERTQPDRRAAVDAPVLDGRSGPDRRANPLPPRKLFGPTENPVSRPNGSLRVTMLVVVVVALSSLLLLWLVPQHVLRVRLLDNGASPGTRFSAASMLPCANS
jgi:hypothetical protein